MNLFTILSEDYVDSDRFSRMSRKRRRHVIRQNKKRIVMMFNILAESPEFKRPAISNQMPGITIEE